MSFIFLGYFSNGVSRLNLNFLDNASSSACAKLFLSVQLCHPRTVIAPSLIESDLSGIISSSSNSIVYPRPKQSGHAPNGLLNEKLLGSIASTEIPQSGQAKFCEKLISSPSTIATVAVPPVSASAVSKESVSLFCKPSLTTILSTTTSIVCFIFLSSLISSESSYIFPSMRTLTYPLFLACQSTFSCLPFLPLTTGARSINLSPCSKAIILSTI